MRKSKNPIELLLRIRNPGRSNSDQEWESVDRMHIEVWQQAAEDLREWNYVFEGGNVSLTIDWRPLIRRLNQDYKVMTRLHDPSVSDQERNNIRFLRSAVRVPIGAVVETKTGSRDKRIIAQQFAESFLHDLFLILNLAAPGCCNFYRANVCLQDKSLPAYLRDAAELSLSSYYFEEAYDRSMNQGWPSAKTLRLSEVISWYKIVRTGAMQVPKSRSEKVLFSMLHLCKGEATLSSVIWLFYGFETMVDTRPGENFRTLVSRIETLLTPTEKQCQFLKKTLRKLYDMRSGFVHGGRDVIHPMHNEILDDRVDSEYGEIIEAADFGFALFLLCLQSLIGNRWIEARFAEEITGQKMDEGSSVPKFPKV